MFEHLLFVASWYPPGHDLEDMRDLYHPCASQRLFLLRLLPEESAALYMDSDVIFLRPIFLKSSGKFSASSTNASLPPRLLTNEITIIYRR
jgi:hypothetical protein